MPTIVAPTLVSAGEVHLCPVLPAEAGIRLVRILDPDAFTASLHEHLFGLVVTATRPQETRTLVRGLRLSVADAHLVVLRSGARPVVDDRVVDGPRLAVLEGPIDPPGLVRALRLAWFEGIVERILRAVRESTLSAVVRCAIWRILEQRIATEPPALDDVAIHRSLTALAAACGTTRETLRRSCRRCGADLRAFMKGWHVALALRERFLGSALPSEGVWRTVARRCGYESDSGLRGLVSRELGIGLSELRFIHLRKQMTRLEEWAARIASP